MNDRKYPTAIVFDLDYTLWPWWCDFHVSPPIIPINERMLVDAKGMRLSLFPDVASILKELQENGVTIIGASRTATPDIAISILSQLHVDDAPLISYFHSLQWGQGSKVRHISEAAKELKLENALRKGEFVLFDDEFRNSDVERINCFFAFIRDDSQGLTRAMFNESIEDWSLRDLS